MATIPPDDPVAFRDYLLADHSRVAAWLDAILTPEQVVRDYPSLARSTKTLANWRSEGIGPRYISGRTIGYRRFDILRELESRTVTPRRRAERA